MGRKVLRGVLLLLALGYAVSYFWNDWLEHLPEPWQTVAAVALLALVALDVAAMSSTRLSRFLGGGD